MDIDKLPTNVLPKRPKTQRPKLNVDELPTNVLPQWPQRENLPQNRSKTMSELDPSSSTMLIDRQRTAVMKRTLPQVDADPTQELASISPELAKLIQRREQVANLETRQMQALMAAAPPQEKEKETPAPTPAAKAPAKPEEKKQPQRRSFGKRKRVPVLQQISIVECGAACLAMLLSYYGRQTTISEIREQCGVGRDGLTALSIVKAARTYGMRVRALSLQDNDFRYVPLPAIVHWEFNHFVVVERWSPKQVEIVDPALGRRKLTAAAFDESFTGVVITMEPGPQFALGVHKSQLTLRTYAHDYIKQAPGALVQVLGTSLLLQLLGLVFPLLSAVAIDQLIPGKLVNALQLFGIGMIMLVPACCVHVFCFICNPASILP